MVTGQPSNIAGLEYLLTAAFSALAALFSWLARRHGKTNTGKLDVIEHQTNGQLTDKIRTVIREEVSHDELVRAVSEEAIRDYLDGILEARLNSRNDEQPAILDDITRITERREQ